MWHITSTIIFAGCVRRQVYNPPNATPIIVEKISEEDFVQQISRLREKRQSLQVKHAYRLRNDSKRALKVRGHSHGAEVVEQYPFISKFNPCICMPV